MNSRIHEITIFLFTNILFATRKSPEMSNLQTAFPFSEIMHLWTCILLNHVMIAHKILISLNREFFVYIYKKKPLLTKNGSDFSEIMNSVQLMLRTQMWMYSSQNFEFTKSRIFC